MTDENPYQPPRTPPTKRIEIAEQVPSRVDEGREWVSLLFVILVVVVAAIVMLVTAAVVPSQLSNRY